MHAMLLDLPGLFAAGLLTFASPCVLPLVPLYLGLLAGTSAEALRRGDRPRGLVPAAIAFGAGLALVFVVLGLAATAAGRVLAEHRLALLRVGGGIVILFGLRFLGVLRLPFLDREARPLLARVGRTASPLSAFAFGAAFALGWTPCVGPVLGSVLTYAASAASSPARGALDLGVYALGIVAPLVAAAAAAPRMLALLGRLKPHLHRIELATGALLVAAGALLATDRLALLTPPSGGAGDAVADASAPIAGASAPAAAPSPSAPFCSGKTAACDLPAGILAPPAPAPAGDGLERALARASAPMPSVVEIVSQHCPVCERMRPVVAQARRTCAGKALRVESAAVEEPDGAALARSHAVRGVPTFLLLGADGREVSRLVGEQTLAQLVGAMRDLTGGRCGS